jgi:hypothetical protein
MKTHEENSGFVELMRKFFLSLTEFGYYKESQIQKIEPLQKLVYGLLTAVLLSVFGVAAAAVTFYMRSAK